MNPGTIKRGHIISLIAIGVIAVFFCFFKLSESPSFWYDEGWYFQQSQNLATIGEDALQFAPGDLRHLSITTVGFPLIYPMALWMKIFGVSVFTARFLMALIILGLLTACFFISKRLFGYTMAICSLLLLATFPPLYANGKSMLGEVPGLLFLVLSLLSFHSHITHTRNTRLWIILAAIFFGLCLVTKPIFLLFAPAFAVGVFIEWRKKRISVSDLLIGAAFTIIPIIVWYLTNFGPGDTLGSILEYYYNPSDKADLISTVIKNGIGLFTSSSTLFTVGLMAVWTIALALKKWARESLSTIEIIAFIFSALIVLAYLRTEGWYRYLFEAQIMALVFLPTSLMYVARRVLVRFRPNWERIASTATIVIVILLGIFNLYQLSFNSWVAEGYRSDKTAYWQNFFVSVEPSTSVFFHNVPEVVPFINHSNYYQYISCAGGIFGEEQLEEIKKGTLDMIITRIESFESEKELFGSYKLSTTTYKYAILVKNNAAAF